MADTNTYEPDSLDPEQRAPDPTLDTGALLDRISGNKQRLKNVLPQVTPAPVAGPTPAAAAELKAAPPELTPTAEQTEQDRLEREQEERDKQSLARAEAIRTQQEKDLGRSRELTEQAVTALQGNQQLQRQQAAQQRPLIDDSINRMLRERRDPRAQPPKMEMVPEVPQLMQASQEWVTAAFIFSALAGAVVRKNSTAALSAVGGMLNGFVDGRKQVVEEQFKQWQLERDRAVTNNKIRLDQYKEYMEVTYDRPIAENAAMMKLISARWQDQMADADSFQKMAAMYDTMVNAQSRMIEAGNNVDKLHQKIVLEGQKRLEAARAGLTPDMVKSIVEQMKAGGNPTTNMGRGKNATAAWTAVQQEISRQINAGEMTPDAIVRAQSAQRAWAQTLRSEAGSLGTRIGAIDAISTVLKNALPQADKASASFTRTQWEMLNRGLLEARYQVSDPKVAALLVSLNQVATEWARAMNPTGTMHEADAAIARKILAASAGHRYLHQALVSIQQGVEVEKRSLQEARGGLAERLGIQGQGRAPLVQSLPPQLQQLPELKGGGTAPAGIDFDAIDAELKKRKAQ